METPDTPKYVAYRHKDESVSVFIFVERMPFRHKMKIKTLQASLEFEVECRPRGYKICDTIDEANAIMIKAHQIWEYIRKREKQRDNLFSEE